jgi:hypothetical protein
MEYYKKLNNVFKLPDMFQKRAPKLGKAKKIGRKKKVPQDKLHQGGFLAEPQG